MGRRRPQIFLAPLLVAAGVLAVALLLLGQGGRGTSHAHGHIRASRGHSPHATAAVPGRRARIVRGPHRDPVPILMYHVISAPSPGAPYPELFTPAPVFAAQVRALAAHGYHGVTLRQVYDYWTKAHALPPHPIVLSFDDGYHSDFTSARPVLRRAGWPGVLNLAIDNLKPGDLIAPEVRALIRAGWEVDSHTVTHPDLTTLPDAGLRDELVRSRTLIRRRFGVPADFFCYPLGRFDARVVAAVRAAGYRAATTTRPGLATPSAIFTLDRIRVDGRDGVSGLLANLAHPPAGAAGAAG